MSHKDKTLQSTPKAQLDRRNWTCRAHIWSWVIIYAALLKRSDTLNAHV